MNDEIYIVNPQTGQPQPLARESFGSLGVSERADLQQWILRNPRMLGEELLVVTSEFDRFDKSSSRLDVLALDKQGTLVIAELKLDASRTLADLQAIRYAAFCSTMTMQDVIAQVMRWRGLSNADAVELVAGFLESEELPELTGEPRIILAAGAFDDQELTSAVMWLRRFAVNISCVEITPYRLEPAGQIILVPRVIIPLPETREFQVSVERKETASIQRVRAQSTHGELWQAVAAEFNSISSEFRTRARRGSIMQVFVAIHNVHYEWLLRSGVIDVSLHSEFSIQKESIDAISPVLERWAGIAANFDLKQRSGPWRRNWAEATVSVPYIAHIAPAEIAPQLAATMLELIERTYPLLLSGEAAKE